MAKSPMNTRYKRARSSMSRTAIDCDHYPDLEEEHNAKVNVFVLYFSLQY